MDFLTFWAFTLLPDAVSSPVAHSFLLSTYCSETQTKKQELSVSFPHQKSGEFSWRKYPHNVLSWMKRSLPHCGVALKAMNYDTANTDFNSSIHHIPCPYPAHSCGSENIHGNIHWGQRACYIYQRSEAETFATLSFCSAKNIVKGGAASWCSRAKYDELWAEVVNRVLL